MAENDTNGTSNRSGIDMPSGAQFQPAAPLKQAGVESNAEGGTLGGSSPNPVGDKQGGGDSQPSGGGGSGSQGSGKASDPSQAVREGVSGMGQQVADKARSLLDDGKSRATGALDQLVQMLNDAAGQVDEKLGGQYGGYARDAATSVQGFADTIRNKDADALINDARGYIRQSPAVAIGVAAALGFAAARLVQSGLEGKRG